MFTIKKNYGAELMYNTQMLDKIKISLLKSIYNFIKLHTNTKKSLTF